MDLLTYIALGLKAAELLMKARQQGRDENDDDMAKLHASDEFRALAEAAWADTLPKPKARRKREK